MARSAAFFDLDKTVIAKSSTLAFSKPFFAEGLLTRRLVLRSAYAQFMFGISGADHDQLERMREYITAMVKGWDVETVRQAVAETLHEIIEPLVYAEAVDLMAMHHAAGRDVVIVSASGLEVVEPVGQMLGVDHVIATRMKVVDGRYSGELEVYAYGPNKAELIRELAVQRGYDLDDCYAYSDSETDVPMLEAVGHPFAVNPDKTLRKVAAENSWPVLSFSKPVALRSPLASTTGKAVAAVGLLSSVGIVAIAVSAMVRRKVAD